MSCDFGWHELLFVLGGLRWTLVLSAVALTVGSVGGFAVALARVSRSAPLRTLAIGYIGLLQGTPELMQLFLVFYGLAVLTGVQIAPWPAVILAFTLYASAFLGEIWRAAIQAVPATQWEAAFALGLRRPVIMLRIVLPQAGPARDTADGGVPCAAHQGHVDCLDHRVRGADTGGAADGQRHISTDADLPAGGVDVFRDLLADIAAVIALGATVGCGETNDRCCGAAHLIASRTL